MKNRFIYFVGLILIILLSGCSKKTAVSYPDCGLQKTNTNNQLAALHLRPVAYPNQFQLFFKTFGYPFNHIGH